MVAPLVPPWLGGWGATLRTARGQGCWGKTSLSLPAIAALPFQTKRRACVVLIKQEDAEDARSISSEIKQTKKPFVASLDLWHCANSSLGLAGLGQGNSGSIWNLWQTLPPAASRPVWKLQSWALHTAAPMSLVGLREKAQKSWVRPTVLSWRFWSPLCTCVVSPAWVGLQLASPRRRAVQILMGPLLSPL